MAGVEGIINRVDFFLLVMGRISGFVILMPLFSNRILIAKAKAALIIILSLLIFPMVSLPPIDVPSADGVYFAALVGEILLGLAMGMITQFVFAAVQTAGQFIDMQIGFGMINVFDPLYGQQIPLMANFLQMLALLLFLTFNGHHLMIEALVKSYQWMPLFSSSLSPGWVGPKVELVVSLFSGMFLTALQLAFPVIGVILIAEFALGIVSRTVPQMNVFVVGFIVKIFLGLLIMMVIMPFYMEALENLFALNLEDLVKFMRAGRP